MLRSTFGGWDLTSGGDGRRRAIGELVRSYMESTWPPADLIVAALKAGVGKKVVREIGDRSGSVSYFENIARDARRLPKRTRARVLKCLEAAHLGS